MSTGDGISRRHVIAGVAWTVPAVVVATAVPAAATSLATGGILFTQFLTNYTAEFWADTDGQKIPAVTVGSYVMNEAPGGVDPGNITSYTYTVVVPVGTVSLPLRWGLGSNSQGVAPNLGFTLVSPPVVANGLMTLTFQWTGILTANIGVYVLVWAAVEPDQLGEIAFANALAQHVGGNTSSDAASGAITPITNVALWLTYFEGRYVGDPPPQE